MPEDIHEAGASQLFQLLIMDRHTVLNDSLPMFGLRELQVSVG